jgi:HK97 family phage portal protein
VGILSWFLEFFNSDGELNISDGTTSVTLEPEKFYKELAFDAGVKMIASAVKNVSFNTFSKGELQKKNMYYLLNVEPNPNMSAPLFWEAVTKKMLMQGEALVIQQGSNFYVADSFERTAYAFKPNTYKNIVVSDYELRETKQESEVLYFSYDNSHIRTLLTGINLSYGKLIKASTKGYIRGKAKRGALSVPTSYPQTERAQEDLNKLLDVRFKKYFEAEDAAVLPLTNGMTYTEPDAGNAKNITEGRDIRALIEDMIDYVAIGMNIPPKLLKGDLADSEKLMESFITFCVTPILNAIVPEINRKVYTKGEYLEKTYIKVDTSMIKYVGIERLATAFEGFFRVGAFSINDILRRLGHEEIDEPWANDRYVTKNYERISNTREEG